MKVTINNPPPIIPPPTSVTIEMSYREAQILRALIGGMARHDVEKFVRISFGGQFFKETELTAWNDTMFNVLQDITKPVK